MYHINHYIIDDRLRASEPNTDTHTDAEIAQTTLGFALAALRESSPVGPYNGFHLDT